jgi:hypothetical protein
MLGLAGDRLADLRLLIYHHCDEPPVESRPVAEGYPSIGWTCPNCGDEVEDLEELRYDLLCCPRGAIEFVE